MDLLANATTDVPAFRLPLADATAVTLTEVLLTPDAPARRRQLVKLLGVDPSLVLWGICRAAQIAALEVRTLGELADWLAGDDLARHLALAASDADRSSMDALAINSINAAHAVAESSTVQFGPPDRDRVYLAALLHNAFDWIEAVNSHLDTEPQALLPSWLGELLPKLSRRQRPADPLAASVWQAVRPGRAKSRTTSEKRQNQVRRHWQCAIPDAGLRLATLLDRLRRLDSLERRFEEMLQREKLEAMAEFAAGAGHEMNPPLAIISGRAQLFLRGETDPERRRELALINRQALRVHEMIADMMHFARPARPQLSRQDLAQLVVQVVDSCAAHAAERQIYVSVLGLEEPLPVEADPTQLTVALRAVLTNSLEALSPGGKIEVELARVDRSPPAQGSNGAPLPSAWAQIVVRDNGPGIEPQVRRHLFDPYFSGRGAGRGLGLGLSKCWRIVTAHGGQVKVECPDGGGCEVYVLLPLDAASSTPVDGEPFAPRDRSA